MHTPSSHRPEQLHHRFSHNAKESSKHKNFRDSVHMESDINIIVHIKFIKSTNKFSVSLITQERLDQYVVL